MPFLALIRTTGAPSDACSQRWEPQREDGSHKQQLRAKIGAIKNQENCIEFADSGHFSVQDFPGNLLIFGKRFGRANPREIDQGNGFIARKLPDVVFDCDARIVGRLLPQAREAIEERGFARVRLSDECHRPQAFRSACGPLINSRPTTIAGE